MEKVEQRLLVECPRLYSNAYGIKSAMEAGWRIVMMVYVPTDDKMHYVLERPVNYESNS